MSSPQAKSHFAADPDDMLAALGGYWGLLLGLGVLSLAAGVLALSWPGRTLRVIAILFALQLLVLGAFRFVTAFARQVEGTVRIAPLLSASLAVLAGILLLRDTFQTIALMSLIVGLFWTVNGVLEMFSAIADHARPYRTLAIAGGVLSTIAGIVFLAYPLRSALVAAVAIGTWLVVFAVIEMLEAARLWAATHRERVTPPSGPMVTG
jgi:uncharacterized membrane protein HdeD (DUF308 family)